MLNTERLCLGCMNDNGGEKICPICNYDSSEKNPDEALPTKFFLKDRYLVGKLTYTNGEGLTYIGWDNASDTIINIKEYFPAGIAHRNPDKTVAMVEGEEYTFNEGLLEFKDIKCHIMSAELPALVPVTDVFEENGTVYSIETNIPSISLNNFLIKNGGTLKWEQARALFLPLIDTLKEMNDLGVIHRGISADTVIVGRDGKLRINNYSVKKLRLTPSPMQSQVYTGYAAVEQYGFEEMHTDTYTDVYGLSATLFKVLIGNVPPEATLRIQNDSMSIPAKFAEELPRQVLAALANGLQVLPENRTRDIETFKNQLVHGDISNTSVVRRNTKSNDIASDSKASKEKANKNGSSAKYVFISAICTALFFMAIAAVLVFGVFKDDIFKPETPSFSSEETQVNAPDVDKIGDIDSGAEVTSKLYTVPDLKGKSYAEVLDNEEYEMFEFAISNKTFSDKYARGTICSQSIAPGGNGVVRDTKIEVVISLGPKEIEIANLAGLTETDAKIDLLKQGFIYENIEVLEKYDDEATAGVVIAQEPEANEKVNTDIGVKIYINSYEGDEESESSSTDSSDTEE